MYTPRWLGACGELRALAGRAIPHLSARSASLVVTWGLLAAVPAGAQVAELPALSRATQVDPADAGAWRALANAQLHAGRFADAATSFELASRLQMQTPAAMYDQARVDFAARDYRAARATCRALAKTHPASAYGDVCEAQAHLVYRRTSRAMPLLERALQREPAHVVAQLVLGEAQRMMGDALSADSAYQQVLASTEAVAYQRALALRGRAHAARLRGDQAGALSFAQAAVRTDEADPEGHYLVAMFSEPPVALPHLQRALQIRPDYGVAQLALGRTLVELGYFSEGEAALRTCLAEQPPLQLAVYGSLGQALFGLGRLAEAEDMLLKAIQGAPQDPAATLTLARVYGQTGRVDDALAQYQRAANLQRLDATPYLEAAELALRDGRKSLAVGYARRAVERGPRQAQTHAVLADGLAQVGDRAGAKQSYQQALSLKPRDATLLGKLNALGR